MKITKGVKIFMTGAASGIGRATAIETAKMGAELFLTDINEKGLAETVDIITKAGGTVSKYRAFDISKYDQVKSFADEIHREHGPMDIVMNIAGIAVWGLIEDLKHEHWEKTINVNLWGPIHVMECFLPETVRAGKGGHLVNVSSVAGLTGAPWHAPYSASKWALCGISEVFRYDFMQHNIGVTLVCPGAVDTPLKHTVEIIGVNKESNYFKKMQEGFTEHSVPPEKVAKQIVKAVEKNKFLILTSSDIKLAYFFKRKFFPVYHYVMIYISRMLNKAKKY